MPPKWLVVSVALWLALAAILFVVVKLQLS